MLGAATFTASVMSISPAGATFVNSAMITAVAVRVGIRMVMGRFAASDTY